MHQNSYKLAYKLKPYLLLYSISLIFMIKGQSIQGVSKISIYFDLNKSELTEEHKTELLFLQKQYKESPHFFLIEAFTDTVGTIDYNNELAKDRLESVVRYLKISSTKIHSIIGEKAGNESDDYIAKNYRRVDIYYSLDSVDIIDQLHLITNIEKQKQLSEIDKAITQFKNDSTLHKFEMDLSILFQFGYPNILPISVPLLNELKDALIKHDDVKIIIHGHVCCGPDPQLASNRASAINSYLSENGIDQSRMKHIGHSNLKPKIKPEITEEDKLQNRRVTIEFLKQ